MEVKIVLGHTFGDEGKGVTVQWLCKKVIEEGKKPLVVRYSGGPQAAHTIFNGGTEHICSSFGSGVLLGVPTVYTEDVYVDPICLMNEYKVLKGKGADPKLSFANCRIITPYDVLAGRNNSKVMSDGTCGKGIYPTFKRYNGGQWARNFFHINDFETILKCVSNYYKMERIPEYDDMFKKACIEMITAIYADRPSIKDCDVLIFEGTQGLLLDMDNGFYPNVTPSRVGLNGLRSSVLQNAEVYLVTRTYTTRHGNGYEPKHRLREPNKLADKYESNIDNEFQGSFKTGILEMGLLNRAYERHCIDNYVKKYNISLNLVVTHMDMTHIIDNKEYSIYSWDYLDNSDSPHYNIHGKENILNTLVDNLVYVPDHVYYNDSVESNIKQLR
jgi:adenylosuccinate synthase